MSKPLNCYAAWWFIGRMQSEMGRFVFVLASICSYIRNSVWNVYIRGIKKIAEPAILMEILQLLYINQVIR